MPLLIIDGYNIINNWPEFRLLRDKNMEGARIKLVELLQDFVPLAWQKIIIVFDAYRVKGNTLTIEEYGALQVIFTAEGQTADSFIERFVPTLIKEGITVEVASSDYMEQNIVLWKGGQRVSARELRERLYTLRHELFASLRPHTGQSLLDERISPKVKTALEKWRRRRY